MIRFSLWFMLCLCSLLPLGCSSTGLSESTSPNAVQFDPTTSNVPLPNILATATAADPLTQYQDPTTGFVGARPATVPLDPLEALAYQNLYEVGGTNAVSGLNAPIYLRFSAPLVPSTVTTQNIKVFQISADTNSPTENNPLGFTDVSALFSVRYTPGTTDVQLFPNFPLLPGTRYLYLVTNRVKDAATSGSVTSSPYFGALKSTLPLTGPFAALEAIRANRTSGNNVLLSGYAKVMDDLIAASSTTTVSSRDQIAVLGRFITTGSGFLQNVQVNANGTPLTVSQLPVDSALRAFAAGNDLGGLTGKNWIADGQNVASVTATIPAAAFWSQTVGIGSAPTTMGDVIAGHFPSADISMNPVVARGNGSMDLNVPFGTYSPATSVVIPFRNANLATGFYYTPRDVPFLYIPPVGAAPAGGWPVVIFQHGITGQKEQVAAVAGALTAAGYAVVAIDLPLHGTGIPGVDQGLAFPQHTASSVWGQDFISVGAPLATRSNIQQAAFNLHRLELVLATPSFATLLAGKSYGPALPTQGFAPLGAAAPNPAIKPKYVSLSLGSIVGAYYLAGNTTLNPVGIPYTQATLNGDMKGLLSVPGGRLAYLIQESPAFGPSVDAGLAANGIAKGSPEYLQFFLLTQTVIDPADPASMTTPLGTGLPSRLSNRILVQEATTTQFSASGLPLDGDQVIPNSSTRYFGNALGGRGVLGTDIAPGFAQVTYDDGSLPTSFMLTLSGLPKKVTAAVSAAATSPTEGYFHFGRFGKTPQSDVTHAFLIDALHSPASVQLAQRQMVYYLGLQRPVVTTPQLVVDPTVTSSALPKAVAPQASGLSGQVSVPKVMKIFTPR
ncbi:lysophospholipase VolA [Geomonas limicola]|uniref:Lysophospholipase VolA n=2 Tax=Geomonas limicola TaxID=2740186 RepID=A0A6V8NDF8_9BACT|nr:lysophospholipase VolA [Geomonas limicola]